MDQSPPEGIVGRTLIQTFFTDRRTVAVITAILLVLIAALPPLGVLIGFGYLLAVLLLCVRQGSLPEIGFRRPRSWSRTLLIGSALGVGAQLVFSVVVDPLLERWTGTPVDVSSLDGMRGHLGPYLVMLAIGWLVGGFLEEMLFRGYLLKRIRIVLGEGPLAVAVAVALPAVAFGLAHAYQDTAGMMSTGLIGALLGAVFVGARGNLWMPIVVHGTLNTAGITLIYTSGDLVLNRLLFS